VSREISAQKQSADSVPGSLAAEAPAFVLDGDFLVGGQFCRRLASLPSFVAAAGCGWTLLLLAVWRRALDERSSGSRLHEDAVLPAAPSATGLSAGAVLYSL